jgi:CDGSH-type Zn-finger protein
MPKHQHSTKKIRGKLRSKVTMRHGEIISLCRCWHSKNFPVCDGSHKDINDERGPVIINTDCDSDFLT